MKVFIALLIALASADAGASDKDAPVTKYKEKFAVLLKDGISTCLHRSTGEEMARAIGG